MSNNKQSMEIYTEIQVIEAIDKASLPNMTILDILENLTPIELPSDEEINKKFEPRSTMYELGYCDGAKWMRDKIGGNNEQ